MQSLSEVYHANRKYLPLFILAFLAIALIVGVYLAQKQQELRSRAAADNGQLTLSPSTVTVQVGVPFSVIPSLLNGGQAVTGADVIVSFDSTKLTLQSITPGTHAIFKTFAPVLPNGTFDTTKVITCANTGNFNGSATNCGAGMGKVDFGIVSFDWKTPPASPGLTSPLPTNTNMSPVATLSFVVKSGTPNGITDITIFNQYEPSINLTQPTTDSNIMVIPAGSTANPEDILQDPLTYSGHTVSVNIGSATGPSPSPSPTLTPAMSPTPSPTPGNTPPGVPTISGTFTCTVPVQNRLNWTTVVGANDYYIERCSSSDSNIPCTNFAQYAIDTAPPFVDNSVTIGVNYRYRMRAHNTANNLFSDYSNILNITPVCTGPSPSPLPSPTFQPAPSVTPSPVASPTFTPAVSPTPSPSGPVFTLDDLKTLLLQFGGKLDEQYFPIDEKINMFDASYVIQNIQKNTPSPTPGID